VGVSLTKGKMGQAHFMDGFCKQIVRSVNAGEKVTYFYEDSILYRGK